MTTFLLRILFISFPLFCGFSAFGQANNECSTAILISNPENFCSSIGAGTTIGATPSNTPPSACGGINNQDVWFSFVAVASEVTINIRGFAFDIPGGTLLLPKVALYSGPCNTLDELACETDLFFNNSVELSATGLTPGETYYFRVEGGLAGTFQYCIRNYFFNGLLSSDCPTAVILCDKSPFNVEVIAGAGNNPNELDDATCFGPGGTNETNSTWYVFTAANNGTLEFTLTPNNVEDDLDFVVYRLPNGTGNCAGKSVVRCMAAGEAFVPSPCMGPTGLSASSTDISEPSGCTEPGQDNFIAALNMVAGTTYALAVNNFTESGNGFQIEWGGTGMFAGPKAGFKSDESDSTICLGDAIVFTDTSTVNSGIITAWHWNFGVGAEPATADTPGPQTVQYTTTGSKIISLRIETSAGCDVTVTRTVLVETCCGISAGFTNDHVDSTVCLGDVVVFTDTSTTDMGAITTWHWNFGAGAQPETADTRGPHTVQYTMVGSKSISLQVENSLGCESTVTQTLLVDTCCNLVAGFTIDIADSVVCLGKTIILTDTSSTQDGIITNFHWEYGSGAQVVTGLPLDPGMTPIRYTTTGIKTILLRVTNSIGCEMTVSRTVVVDSCCVLSAGFVSNNADSTVCIGKAVVFDDTSMANGDTLTSWQWNFGSGAQPAIANTRGPHTIRYATAGSKNITLQVKTAIGCESTVTQLLLVDTCCGLMATIKFPPECPAPCATATVVTSGAFPPVIYQWSSGQTDSVVTDLVVGDYIITVTDALGCTDTVSFHVEEPQQFDIPNAFTPNGDNVNDLFFPVGSGFEVLEFAVYSRWGKKVWSGTSGGWDGRLDGSDLPSDVYAYRSKVRYKGVLDDYHGEVILLR